MSSEELVPVPGEQKRDVVGDKQINRHDKPIIREYELPDGKKFRVRFAPGQIISLKRELKRQKKAGLI